MHFLIPGLVALEASGHQSVDDESGAARRPATAPDSSREGFSSCQQLLKKQVSYSFLPAEYVSTIVVLRSRCRASKDIAH